MQEIKRIYAVREYFGELEISKKDSKQYIKGGTIAKLYDERNFYLNLLFLERPKTNKTLPNQRDDKTTAINDSCCIPEGSYQIRDFSGAKFKNVIEILNVENRQSILIHCGNVIDDSLGCCLIGKIEARNIIHKGKIYELHIANSKQALQEFKDYISQYKSKDGGYNISLIFINKKDYDFKKK